MPAWKAWPEENQGWTSECWAFAVALVFLHFGTILGKPGLKNAWGADIAQAVFPGAPNQPTDFSHLHDAIDKAASMYGGTVDYWNGDGYVYDANDVPRLADAGWGVIVCAFEGYIKSGQNYGHFFVVRAVDGQGDCYTVDSFHLESGVGEALSWPTVEAAIVNWDGGGPKAVAFKVS